MQFTRNLKHIFIISLITLFFIGIIGLIPDFLTSAKYFITYRDAPLQNSIFKFNFNPSKDIAIIKIDDASINELQAGGNLKMLSIPKKIYIDMIKKLESVGVKGIGFDIVFENADPDEEKFRDVLESYTNIVIATSINSKKSPECVKDKEEEGKTQYENCSGTPRSVYKDVSWGLAHIDKMADKRIAMIDTTKIQYIPWDTQKQIDTFPLALYKKISGTGAVVYNYNHGDTIINPYFGKPGSYSYISLKDVLNMSKVDMIKTFGGKIILIGENGTLIHDEVISPVTGTLMAGVETHAHMLDGFLQNRIPKELGGIGGFLILLCLLVSAISGYLLIPSVLTPFLGFIIFYTTILIARWLYGTYGIIIDILPLLFAGSVLSYPITFIYKFFIVDRERRFIQSAFSHYIDPVIVEKIADNKHPVELGGEKKEVTVFFSDIAGFTTISEKLETKELFRLMSKYLSTMTDILIRNHGTLDKYIGDAIMGFFGAPLPVESHPAKACKAALEMRRELTPFNEKLIKNGTDPIDFRIGIASGEVMIGNIGSVDRFNYTALGDTVNLASRLEGAGKEYATHIIVSESVYLATKDTFLFRKLDKLRVKGKTEPILIYELVGEKAHTSSSPTANPPAVELGEVYSHYETALDLYFAGSYLEAGKLFEANSTEDPTSLIMAKRCLHLIQEKIILPDGVWEMKTK